MAGVNHWHIIITVKRSRDLSGHLVLRISMGRRVDRHGLETWSRAGLNCGQQESCSVYLNQTWRRIEWEMYETDMGQKEKPFCLAARE